MCTGIRSRRQRPAESQMTQVIPHSLHSPRQIRPAAQEYAITWDTLASPLLGMAGDMVSPGGSRYTFPKTKGRLSKAG